MKSRHPLSTFSTLGRIFLLAGILMCWITSKSWGQTYADTISTSVTLTGSVSNPTQATDGNLTTAGTINTGLAGTATMVLKFRGQSIPAYSPVFIRVTNGITLLSGFTIVTYTGSTSTSTGTSSGTASSYLTTINGNTFMVVNSTTAINGIGITLGGIVGSVDIYYAYFNVLSTGCISPITTATSSTGVNIGSIQNPAQAIDGNLTTYSNFNVTAAVAGTMTQSVYYSNQGSSTQSATITLSSPGSNLATLNLLGNITIQAYNGNTTVGAANTVSSLLSLSLLSSVGSNNPMNLSINPGAAFNRVDITSSTTLGLLSGVRIYEVTLTPPKPTFTLPINDTVYACNGSTVTLTADNPTTGNELRWYSSALASNTTVLATGSYTPPFAITSDTVFYVATGQTGCTPSSERVPVTILVQALPSAPIAPSPTAVCVGNNVTLTITSPGTDYYKWYSASTSGTSLFTGSAYIVSPATTTIYYVIDSSATTGCVSNPRVADTAKIISLPSKPSALDVPTCSGTSITLAVVNPISGNSYNWFKSSSGGTTIHTGTTYTSTALTADTTLYLQSDSSGCSSKRDTVIVTVNALPTITFSPSTFYACKAALQYSLSYSGVTNSPTTDSIAWSAGAMPPFANTATAAISNPILIAIPVNTNAGSYSGTLYIKNANGCSNNYPFTLNVVNPPSAPPPNKTKVTFQ